MDDEKRKAFEQQLLQMKVDLETDELASRGSDSTVELDQSRVGRLSRMDAMQAQQMALEAARRRQQQLVKINAALRRIESGEFGICAVCEEEIDHRRLQIDPTSIRCVGCYEE